MANGENNDVWPVANFEFHSLCLFYSGNKVNGHRLSSNYGFQMQVFLYLQISWSSAGMYNIAVVQSPGN